MAGLRAQWREEEECGTNGAERARQHTGSRSEEQRGCYHRGIERDEREPAVRGQQQESQTERGADECYRAEVANPEATY